MVLLTVLAFFLSFLAGVWIIRSPKAHARLYGHDMPQRFHSGAVPRIGGVALGGGMFMSWLVAALFDSHFLLLNTSVSVGAVLAWGLALLPTVGGGLVMGLLTMLLFAFAWSRKRHGRINRVEGGVLLAAYIGYTVYLLQTAF